MQLECLAKFVGKSELIVNRTVDELKLNEIGIHDIGVHRTKPITWHARGFVCDCGRALHCVFC